MERARRFFLNQLAGPIDGVECRCPLLDASLQQLVLQGLGRPQPATEHAAPGR